jgi:hypothetical protein
MYSPLDYLHAMLKIDIEYNAGDYALASRGIWFVQKLRGWFIISAK